MPSSTNRRSRTLSIISGWPPTRDERRQQQEREQDDADHRPRAVEPAGRLARVDPPAPAVARDAGQLVAERVVQLGVERRIVVLTGSLAGLVALGIDRLRVRRRGAALRQHVAGDLQHLLVGQRLADAVRQHALQRIAGLDAGHDVADRAAVQPVDRRSGSGRPGRRGRRGGTRSRRCPAPRRWPCPWRGWPRRSGRGRPALRGGRPQRGRPRRRLELGLVLGNHAGVADERLRQHVVVHEVDDARTRSSGRSRRATSAAARCRTRGCRRRRDRAARRAQARCVLGHAPRLRSVRRIVRRIVVERQRREALQPRAGPCGRPAPAPAPNVIDEQEQRHDRVDADCRRCRAESRDTSTGLPQRRPPPRRRRRRRADVACRAAAGRR